MLCALVAAVLVACDLSPLAGVGDTAERTPVETVTALEVDLHDPGSDATAQARHAAPASR